MYIVLFIYSPIALLCLIVKRGSPLGILLGLAEQYEKQNNFVNSSGLIKIYAPSSFTEIIKFCDSADISPGILDGCSSNWSFKG